MDSNLSQVSKEVAKGTLWSILGTLFFKLCSFFYVVLIARVVSQDDIGILYLCMSITGLLSFASEFGIVSAMVRYIPFFHGKNENKKIFDMINFSYLTVLLSIIITIIMFWQADTIADFYALPQLAGALRFFSIFLVVNSLNKIFSNVLAGFADIKSTQFGSNLQNFLKLAITLLLFYLYGTNLTNLVFGYVLSFILPTLLMFWLMKSRLSSIDLTGEGITRDELVKDIAPFGFLIMVLGSFSVLLGSVDKLVLGYLLNPNESASLIGIYSIASGLATMVMIFPPTIGAIFFPVVSRLFGKNDLDGIRSITETAQRWVLFITLPVAIVFLVFADDLLVLFYGDAYAPGHMVMIWWVLAFVISSITYIISYVLAAMRFVKIEISVLAITTIINIILAFVLIPFFGIDGAAAAIAISSVVSAVLLLYYGHKVINYSLSAGVYKIILAFLLTAVVLALFKPYLVSLFDLIPTFDPAYFSKLLTLVVLSFFSLFVLSVFLLFALPLKCLHREDVSLARSIMGRLQFPTFLSDFVIRLASYGVK